MAAIYLDHAAATPLAPQVLEAMQPYLHEQFYNPSATYLAAQQTRKALDAARAQVARCIGSRPSEVIFTAGGTEANNLAIHGIMRANPGTNIVVSAIEHEAVIAPAHRYDCREVAVTNAGILDLESLKRSIDDQTVLISIMYANNEVGTIQPLREVGHLVQQIRRERQSAGNMLPLYFHADACQASNYLDLHVSRLGVDMLTLNGGKIYGPKQSGALYVKGGLQLRPLIDGGGQERGLRSGTENVASAVGFALALELAQNSRHEEAKRLQALQSSCIRQLTEAIPAIVINGSLKQRLPNNIHVTIPGYDNERLLIELDEAGIMAAAGSACSASNEEPSHVLRAMGINEADAQSSLRFTLGQSTTEADVQHLTAVLSSLVSVSKPV